MKAFKRVTADGGLEYRCSKCDAYKKADCFYPSAIERFYPYCKDCQKLRKAASVSRSVDASVANNLYATELSRHGRYGDATTLRPLPLVREVLAVWNHKSAISGATDNLRVRRLFGDLPLSPENAVPVTAGESQRLTRARTPEAVLALFPAAVQPRLAATRALLLAPQQVSPDSVQ